MTRTIAIAALASASAFAQSIEAKLDHAIIAVRDLDSAKVVYSGLGFAVIEGGRHPTGTQNSAARFSGGGYLELITPYDAGLPGGKRYAELLKKGDGPAFAGLEITSAEQAAKDLSAVGVKVSGPTPGTIIRPGETTPPPTRWWSLGFENEIASRPLFLLQYVRDPSRQPPPRPPNPNSASYLSALFIAINDSEKAAAGYGNIGKLSGREIELPEFGAIAKEIVLTRGSIFLLRSTDPTGPTAQHLKSRGEGILGVRLSVADLGQTRKSIGEKNISKDHQFVLVAPENAAGAWLQFR